MHPLVQETGKCSPSERRTCVKRILLLVRDDVRFGFAPEGDLIKASEKINRGYG